ncbi:MAG: helix-turn-helix domain-containing protein [Treponema sp.]|jgi:hypothetical protein|nr:helix-turn-helix domain-containing protein [Treponema sp.]
MLNPETGEMLIPEAFASRMFFTDAEVAVIAGKNRETIARWRREGYLEAARFGKRTVMFRRAEVERLVRGEIDFSKPPVKRKEEK